MVIQPELRLRDPKFWAILLSFMDGSLEKAGACLEASLLLHYVFVF